MRSVAGLRRVWIGLWIAMGLVLMACGGAGGSGSNLPDPKIRFFNGSPDSVALNFLIDDDVEGSQLSFLQSTPDFASTNDGIRDIRIQEEGTSVDLWSEVLDMVKDHSYLVSAIGLENFGSEPLKRIRFLVADLDRTPPNGTRAELIIVHGYNREAGLETPGIDFQTPGDNPQFETTGIAYATARQLDVDAGTWTFEARREGTETILVSQNVTLTGGKIYAAYILGVENGVGALAPRIEFVEIQTD